MGHPGYTGFVKAVHEATIWMNGPVNNLDSIKGKPLEKQLKAFFLNQGNNIQNSSMTNAPIARDSLLSLIKQAILDKDAISVTDFNRLYNVESITMQRYLN